MNAIDIAERQALASPRDFPEDFYQRVYRNVCSDCGNVFEGLGSRTQCRVCEQTHGRSK